MPKVRATKEITMKLAFSNSTYSMTTEAKMSRINRRYQGRRIKIKRTTDSLYR